MSLRLRALLVDGREPLALAAFWSELLSRGRQDGPAVVVDDDTGLRLRFMPSEAPVAYPSRVHFHLTSDTANHQARTVERALGLGARHLDVGQLPEEGHVVLADPEGNPLCVIEAGNRFLADCGFFAEVACDGSEEVGRFWSAALDWPLVWDQDQETAIRHPRGGPIIAWGGPPVAPVTGEERVRFDLAVDDGSLDAELERLRGLGAVARGEPGPGGVVTMTDPDGNVFGVSQS